MQRSPSFGVDGRASAEGVSAILSISTLLLFMAIAVPALGSVTEASADERRHQLQFHGERLAGEIQAVDRLVRRSQSPGEIGRYVDLPERVGGEQFVISTVQERDGDQFLLLQSTADRTSARIPFVSETSVENTTVTGGPLYVVRDSGDSINLKPGSAR